MRELAKLKELGYCQTCLPDKYRCRAVTKKGTRCTTLAGPSGYCKQHKKNLLAQKRKQHVPAPITEGNCIAITNSGKRCQSKAVYGKYCKVHAHRGKKPRKKYKRTTEEPPPDIEQIVRPDYKEYINSERWRIKSTEAKKRAGWRCQVCNTTGNFRTLHAHHRTYDRLGNERPEDITVLCERCHTFFHTIIKL